MKILITANSYYPSKDGVSVVTTYLAEGLAKKGHKVTILVKNNGFKLKEIHNDVKIIRFDEIGFGKFDLYTIGDKKKYINLVKDLCKKNDIMINVCTQCPSTDWLLNSLDDIHIPKVLYMHGMHDFKFNKNNFKNVISFGYKIILNAKMRWFYFINRNNLKKYDVVTQLHEKDPATICFRKKFNIESVIIENAANDSFFDDYVDNNIDLPEKYILNVSNYNSRKNQMRFLKIFLNSKISNKWHLIFIGSEENDYSKKMLDYYKKYKANGGEKSVSILAGIPRQDIQTYVKKSSIYAMTSTWEAFPISICEAKAAGVPFLSTDVGIVKYLSGGQICYSDDDFEFWLNKFCNCEKLRKSYGELGRIEALEKMSIDNKVKQLEKLLIEILKGKNEK